jgi:hypothetical protein
MNGETNIRESVTLIIRLIGHPLRDPVLIVFKVVLHQSGVGMYVICASPP